MRRRKELLPENLREGSVYKIPLFKFKHHEISWLILLPFAQIKYHEHKEDSEVYLVPRWMFKIHTKWRRVCQKGKGHHLANRTFRNLHVLSIKWW